MAWLCFSLWSHGWRSPCLKIWQRHCPMARSSASWPITSVLVLCQSSTSPHRQWWANACLLFHKTKRGPLSEMLIYADVKKTDFKWPFLSVQPKLSAAKCRLNVENFIAACRRLGVPEVNLYLLLLLDFIFFHRLSKVPPYQVNTEWKSYNTSISEY